MKCFVCQKEYDENNKETALVTVAGNKIDSLGINEEINENKCLNLCPQCLRQTYVCNYTFGNLPEPQGMFYTKKIKEVNE